MSYHHTQEPSKSNARKEKEAAPADEDDSTSSVVNLTDANFESVVRESTADILLDFYGTYVCGGERGTEGVCVCVCVCVCIYTYLCVCAYVCTTFFHLSPFLSLISIFQFFDIILWFDSIIP